MKNILLTALDLAITLKNLRRTLILRGEDFAQSGELSDNEFDKNPLLENSTVAADPLTPLEKQELDEIWNSWTIDQKSFYLKLKQNNVEAEDRTEAEEFLKSIREVKYVGNRPAAALLNIFFSPSLFRIIAVAAAVSILFTPFGYAIGAVGMSLALATVAFDVYKSVSKYRELNAIKEEYLLLEKIKEAQNEISKDPKLLEDFAKETVIKRKTKVESFEQVEVRLTDSVAEVMAGDVANIGWSVTIAVLTLSPISILLTLLSISTGSSVSIASEHQFNQRCVQLHNINTISKKLLGLDLPIKGMGKSGPELSTLLSETIALKTALNSASEARKVGVDDATIGEKFGKILVNKPEVSLPQQSFLQDTLRILADGFNWRKSNMLMTPSFIKKEMDVYYSQVVEPPAHVVEVPGQEELVGEIKGETLEAKAVNCTERFEKERDLSKNTDPILRNPNKIGRVAPIQSSIGSGGGSPKGITIA